MCSVAQRDPFLQACLCAEYPTISSRSAFFPPSKSRKLQMLALCAASLTTDHSRRERSLSTLNDLPTSPRSSLACLYARECKFLLAETHGIGEDCESRVQFPKHFVPRMGAILTCSVVVCWAHKADSGGNAKGSDVAPRGLSSLHLG